MFSAQSMGMGVFGGVMASALIVLSCNNATPDLAQQELEALQRNRAETAARRARMMGTDPESIAAAENAKTEASRRMEGREACKRLAQGTRDCNAGKQCTQVDPVDMKHCAHYMASEGLERNPF